MKKLSWKKFVSIGALCAGVISFTQMPSIVSAQTSTMDDFDRIKVSNENYESLFGDEAFPGAKNDPELADTMKRFVYGNVAE